MVRRIALAALWFISSWLTYGLVAYFIGIPDTGGAVLGALVAALVLMDPTGSFSGRVAPRESRRRRQRVLQPEPTTVR